MTNIEKQIEKISDAIGETERRIVLRAQDAMGWSEDDWHHGHYMRMVERMEANNNFRHRQICDLVSKAITGRRWNEFCQSVKGGYTPSVSKEVHGVLLTRIFNQIFEERFGRKAYIY